MSDCCSAPGLLPFEQALSDMLAQVTPISDVISLPIAQALSYVLCQDIHSPLNVPPHDNSAMDAPSRGAAITEAEFAAWINRKTKTSKAFVQLFTAFQGFSSSVPIVSVQTSEE